MRAQPFHAHSRDKNNRRIFFFGIFCERAWMYSAGPLTGSVTLLMSIPWPVSLLIYLSLYSYLVNTQTPADMDHGFASFRCNVTAEKVPPYLTVRKMWRQTKTAISRRRALSAITFSNAGTGYYHVWRGQKDKKKKCIARLHVEMAHSTSIFVNPLHANFERRVHPGATINAERWRYTFTLSLTLALDEGGWSTPPPSRFTRGKETCTGGWAGAKANLHGCRKSHSHQDSIPRVVQLVENRYTDCAITAHHATSYWRKPVMVWVHGSVWLFVCSPKAGSYLLTYWGATELGGRF
jgi:hypothetical protein